MDQEKDERTGLKIVWSPRAIKGLERIHKYVSKHFSKTVADRVLHEIAQRIELLSFHPESGILEPNLQVLGMGSKSVTKRYSKIVYQVFPDHIFISAVYDMRMDFKSFHWES